MAEIIPLQVPCQVQAPKGATVWVDGLRGWIDRLPWRRQRRVGNADDLPDRLRRDMGLAPRAPEPGRHYSDYISSGRA